MAKLKFSFSLITCQIIFVIIFGLLAEYEEPAQAKSRSGKTPVTAMYPRTIFLWLYWPSFNGGAASGGEQYRAVINTYLSLVACTIITFALSSIVDKNGKLEMSGVEQGGYQMVALIITLAIALVGGTITGFILKLPVCDRPDGDSLFDDRVHWNISTEGYPSGVITNGERNYINSSDDPRTNDQYYLATINFVFCVQAGAMRVLMSLKNEIPS
ncbi:CD241 [Mytilus edulis]|uniref:SLC42A n=1 Tax=Mytilus edulis TaxID=6550 RepID=A0A8S3TK60_MYTED|nr:CD241 [Mytilus edulis]